MKANHTERDESTGPFYDSLEAYAREHVQH